MIDDPTSPDYRPPPLREEMTFNYTGGEEPGYGDEVTLLGSAMASGDSLLTLSWLEPKEFIADPRNRNVAQAILDLAYVGAPHNAEMVTTLLRARGQLPIEWDPQRAMRDVDPRGYALGAWESTAMPPDYAARCAVEIRHRFARHAVRSIATTTLETLDRTEGTDRESWEGTALSPERVANQMVSWTERIPPPLVIPPSFPEPYPEGSTLGLPDHPKLSLHAKLAMQESARITSTRGLR